MDSNGCVQFRFNSVGKFIGSRSCWQVLLLRPELGEQPVGGDGRRLGLGEVERVHGLDGARLRQQLCGEIWRGRGSSWARWRSRLLQQLPQPQLCGLVEEAEEEHRAREEAQPALLLWDAAPRLAQPQHLGTVGMRVRVCGCAGVRVCG